MDRNRKFFSVLASSLLAISCAFGGADGSGIAAEPSAFAAVDVGEAAATAADPAVGNFWKVNYVNGIVAIADGRPITADELRHELLPAMAQIERESTSRGNFEARVRAAAEELLNRMVDRALIVQEFERSGMKVPEVQKNFQLDEFIRNRFQGDRSRFTETLREHGKTLGQFKREMEEGFIVDWMLGRIRQSRAEISPLQVLSSYNEHREEFHVPAALRMGQIYVAEGEGDGEELAEQLRGGENFATLRDRLSPETARMEDEWVALEDLRSELQPVIDLEPGACAGPFPVGAGSVIVTVLERRGGQYQPLEDVQDEIEGRLFQSRLRETQERWLSNLRRQAYVRTYLQPTAVPN
jgi:parvulin-like peptidyl-prolyl isomerase